MTYLLVCALCAGTAGPASSSIAEPGASALVLDVGRDTSLPDVKERLLAHGTAVAAARELADPSAGEGHPGHDGGAHMGPMWIMMAVMMAGMMVALGATMMRGHRATPLQPGGTSSPLATALPAAVPFRPGG
jgi:hypothetical protein